MTGLGGVIIEISCQLPRSLGTKDLQRAVFQNPVLFAAFWSFPFEGINGAVHAGKTLQIIWAGLPFCCGLERLSRFVEKLMTRRSQGGCCCDTFASRRVLIVTA